MSEKGRPLLMPTYPKPQKVVPKSRWIPVIVLLILSLSLQIWLLGTPSFSNLFVHTHFLDSYCSHLPPISLKEFQARQQSLASTLFSLGSTAYIAEPGASAGYFGNITSSHWGLSERPLLLVVSPAYDDAVGVVKPNIFVLTPSFEETRAKLLPIPQPEAFGASSVQFIPWPEETNPFAILADHFKGSQKIFVDPAIRHFIVDGLQKAFGDRAAVTAAPIEVKKLREQKSSHELELMKCVNEATVLSIREVRKKMWFGMKESQAAALMRDQLSSAGLKNGGCLTLFGDCGATLHGYHSDITRTFALDGSHLSSSQIRLWSMVHAAQSKAFLTAKRGISTGTVDEAARNFLTTFGYGQYFTHRLGHGIGLEGHESPYLRGSSQDIIDIGHSFSNEPGIYIEGELGIRLEDCFYIGENGEPVYFTEPAKAIWAP
ncbi:Creatinase/aminopeptidase [Flagelloscypha sp. PMI_526]|nr:Creatinase/aminopeptidase [Flagelloscypha sp. PMI_526]